MVLGSPYWLFGGPEPGLMQLRLLASMTAGQMCFSSSQDLAGILDVSGALYPDSSLLEAR